MNRKIDGGAFSGEVLDGAKKVRSEMQKQKDMLSGVLDAAKKQAKQ